ncbi:MAG: tetratricopeptide repeat protein [Nannocystaceae bacterium]
MSWPSAAVAGRDQGPAKVPEPEASEPEVPPAEGAEEDPPAPTPETEPSAAPDPGSVDELSPEELAARQKQIRIENAQRHYEQGNVLFRAGRYAEAAAQLELSYAAVPATTTLYSVALSYARAGKAVDAVRTLRRYLDLPDCVEQSAQSTIGCTNRRAEAEQMLGDQVRLVGELNLDLADTVELREVRVAGRTVPLDDFPLLLRPGPADVELFGLEPEQRRTRVAYITAGETFTLYVAPFVTEVVQRPDVPDATPDPRIDEARAQRRQRILMTSFWVGTGLTAASAVALGVMGGLTRREQQAFKAAKCEMVCADPDTMEPLGNSDAPLFPLEERDAFNTYKLTTNVLVGVTVGLAVGTVLVGAFAFRKRGRGRARVRATGPGLVVRW